MTMNKRRTKAATGRLGNKNRQGQREASEAPELMPGLRRALLGSTSLSHSLTVGLAAAAGIGGALLVPGAALAANECGTLGVNTVRSCVATSVTSGIEYGPGPANSAFTLNIGDGTVAGATAVVAPTIVGVGQYGAVIGGGVGFPTPITIPSAGANATATININQFSQVQGTGGGVLVWTTGVGNSATINNAGTVLTPGTGTLATGIGLAAVSNNSDATVVNLASGTVNALNNGLNGYSLSSTSLVTLSNDGLVNSQNRDGMSSIDPVAGLVPTLGAATATNNGTLNAGRHGINLGAAGNSTVNLGATSVINAGTGAGVLALSLTGNTIINGNALSQTKSTSGPGMVGLAAGTTTIDAGVVNSGSGLLNIAGFPIPNVSGGVIGVSGGTSTINAHGNVTTSGLFGVMGLSLNGDANVTVDPNVTINSTAAANSTGIWAASLAGNTTINAGASTTTNSTSGPGIVGLSLAGTSTVDAGVVTSGSDAVNLFGFTLPALPGLPSISGGVISLASGDATANAHGNITTTGSFGVLALSLSGDATTTADAGILVDPPIGMASITVGSGTSTVTNNATQNTTLAGLLGVNIGDGAVNITNSNTGNVNATGGAGVVAIKIGAGDLANSVDGTNSVVVTNDNGGPGSGGNINAPSGPGVFVLALDPTLTTPNNVLVNNTNFASITGAGGLLTSTVGVFADGNVVINNLNNSSMDNDTGPGGLSVLSVAGGNVNLTSDENSTIRGQVDIASIGGNAQFLNDRGSDWTFSGLSAIGALNDATLLNDRGSQINGTDALLAIVAGNNAGITNDRGADLNLSGVSANLMFAGNDASILNDRGGTFNINGVGANVMVALNNASITNTRGGDFTLTGVTSGHFMGAGNDASITNTSGGTFTMTNLANANVMVANCNASITNDRGSFSMAGLVSANVMVANTGNASILNDHGGSFDVVGLAGGNFMDAGTDATILNDRGGSFSMTDLLNANVMVADANASIHNDRGGDFSLEGINGNVMVATNGAASITNERGADFDLLGLTGSLMVAGNGNASIDNNRGATMNFEGISGNLMVASNGNATIDNSRGGQINFRGLNGVGFLASGTSTVNNDSVIRVGGLGGFTGITTFFNLDQFNNRRELTMMDGVVGDRTLLCDTLLCNTVGVSGSNYFGGDGLGGDGLLSVDVFLDGQNGSASDLLWIEGNAAGTTLIAVDDLHGGPGTYDPNGTKLVYAGTATSGPLGTEFALRDGPMDYGLYTYDLKYFFNALDPSWILANGPNARAFELATLPSQIQTMASVAESTWHDRTADLRDDAGRAKDGGGAWARAVGVNSAREYDQSYTDQNGTYTHQGTSDQAIGGVVAGIDTVINSGDVDVAIGVLGSVLASRTEFDDTGTSVDMTGTGAGVYATLMSNGFFVDAVGHVRLLGIDYATAAPWADSASTDGMNYSVVIDAGYRADLGAMTIEPMATLAYNRTTIDGFDLLGNSVSYDAQESLRGRLGVRVAGAVTIDKGTIKPFLEANLWNEFKGENTATISGGAVALTLGDDVSGLSGELKGGFELFTDGGWSGTVSGLIRGNELTTTVGAQAGVRVSF